MKNQKRTGNWNRTAIVLPLTVMLLMIGIMIEGGRRQSAAASTTYTVTSLNDSGAGSLRQAILDANANPGADTINFEPGLTGTIQLASGELVITDDLEMNGPGATSLTVSGNNASRVFFIQPGNPSTPDDVTVAISGLTISNGSADGLGGGIFSEGVLTITSCTVSNNSSGAGGGIYSAPECFNCPGGVLTIINSTVSGNSATTTNGGGGITNGSREAMLTIINSTVSGNSSPSDGGGIINGGTVTILNSTLSNNSATGLGGGIFNATVFSTVNIKNSIVANGQSGDNCSNEGTFNASGTNFSTDGTCPGFTKVTPVQLNLFPLALNAPGLTATHTLGPGSVAIDAVDDCTDLNGNPVTEDQRGVARPRGPKCDAGAFEAEFHYTFTGFFAPVSNVPVVNVVKAGKAIPVKFSLGGDQGLGILAQGFPLSGAYGCDSDAPTSAVEETLTAGNSSLSYDTASDQYSYVWKTESSWAGSCRQLVVKLNDGSTHVANFQFK